MRFLGCAILVYAFCGCGGGIAELRQEVRELRARVDEVSRTGTAARTRLDNVENRLLLIQDELETDRLAARRPAPVAASAPVTDVPSLPVVRIVPPADRTRKAAAEPASRDTEDDDAYAPPRAVASREAAPALGDNYATIDEQGRVVGSRAGRGPAPADVTRPAPTRAKAHRTLEPTDDSEALAEYKAAFDLYEQGRRTEAMKDFAAFVAAHPRHPYADNAQYWIGECLYDARDYEGAKREFQRVVADHPDGNKVPDAMVKVGLCEQMLRRFDEARRMFDTVMITYPDSPAAGVALRLLGELP